MNHISDELPRLLTGDATHDVVMAAAEHLRECPDCQQELVSAVVAHASLTSAHRFAPEVVAPIHDPLSDGRHSEDSDPGADVVELPNMSSMFDQVRDEAAAAAKRPAKRRPARRTVLAVAAAAVVLAGGGTAIGTALTSDSPPSTTQVALRAYQSGTHPAKAVINGSRISVDATSLPRLNENHQYEVWLTDSPRQNMQSIGFIANNNKAVLTVPSKVKLSNYNDIEVSVQRVGQSNYSGKSVLRGSYG